MAEGILHSSSEARIKHLEEMDINEGTRSLCRPKCEICVRENVVSESETVFLCFECEIYVCVNCTAEHRSHKGMRLGTMNCNRYRVMEKSDSTEEHSESERMLNEFIEELMIETENERNEKLKNRHVCINDRVNVKHVLDKNNCGITQLCKMEKDKWMVCDNFNSCVKIFKEGSNVLQRYIRFGFFPWGRYRDICKTKFYQPELRVRPKN